MTEMVLKNFDLRDNIVGEYSGSRYINVWLLIDFMDQSWFQDPVISSITVHRNQQQGYSS